MKHLNVIASVILAAAVLLAAYAIGRLVRQARIVAPEPQPQLVAEPDEPNDQEAVIASRRIAQGRKEPTPEERAKIKEARAEKLAQMSNLTDEEKLQLRDEWREQLRSRRGEPGRVPRLSPEELEQISQRWHEMSDEEKQAFRARMRGRGRMRRATPDTTTNKNESSQDSLAGPGDTEAGDSEPNETGQN